MFCGPESAYWEGSVLCLPHTWGCPEVLQGSLLSEGASLRVCVFSHLKFLQSLSPPSFFQTIDLQTIPLSSMSASTCLSCCVDHLFCIACRTGGHLSGECDRTNPLASTQSSEYLEKMPSYSSTSSTNYLLAWRLGYGMISCQSWWNPG